MTITHPAICERFFRAPLQLLQYHSVRLEGEYIVLTSAPRRTPPAREDYPDSWDR
jgi:hypothetical protein